MTCLAAMTARPSTPLDGAWSITALVCGPVGFLLLVWSESSVDRLHGVVLGAFVLLGVMTAAVTRATAASARFR